MESQQAFVYRLIYLPVNMEPQILQALTLSFDAKDNQEIQMAESFLKEREALPGYVPQLLMIVNHMGVNQNQTCSALAQLKNVLRRRWNFKEPPMSLPAEDKLYFMENIVQTNINLADHIKFSKLMKDIIGIAYSDLMPKIGEVVHHLLDKNEIRSSMNFLLGLSSYFHIRVFQQTNIVRIQYLHQIIPPLTDKLIAYEQNISQMIAEVQNQDQSQQKLQRIMQAAQQFEQLYYLSVKLMSKLICQDFTLELRNYACHWANVCIQKLLLVDETKRQFVSKDNEFIGTPMSPSFVYYHLRKWSVKYIKKFIRNIMTIHHSKHEITEITEKFYASTQKDIQNMIKVIFQQPAPIQFLSHQLSFVQTIIELKPQFLLTHLDYFLFQVLPQYIYYNQKDKQMMRDNPMEFLYFDKVTDRDEDNLRNYACHIWISLMTHYNYTTSFKAEVIDKCLAFIESDLESGDQKQTIRAVKLFINLNIRQITIDRTVKIGQILQRIAQRILSFFTFQIHNPFFHGFIYDMMQLSKISIPIENLRMISTFTKAILLTETFNHVQDVIYIKAKALISLRQIFYVQKVHRIQLIPLNQSERQALLWVLLTFISEHDVPQIMHSILALLSHQGNLITHHLLKVFDTISQKLKSSFEKTEEREKNSQYSKIMHVINVGERCLTVMSLIAQLNATYKNLALKERIQQQVIQLLHYFCRPANDTDYQLKNDYFEPMLIFVQSYLISQRNSPFIPSQIFFFYFVSIWKFIGLPKRLRETNHPIVHSNNEKETMLSLGDQPDIYINNVEDYTLIITYFIKFLQVKKIQVVHGSHFRGHEQELSPLQTLFYMADYFYQQEINLEPEDITRGRVAVTVFLIYLLEQHPLDLHFSVFHNILQIITKNDQSQNFFFQYLRRDNIQLFSVWLFICFQWHKPLCKNRYQSIVDLLINDSDIYEQNFHEPEAIRIILGCSAAIKLITQMKQRQQARRQGSMLISLSLDLIINLIQKQDKLAQDVEEQFLQQVMNDPELNCQLDDLSKSGQVEQEQETDFEKKLQKSVRNLQPNRIVSIDKSCDFQYYNYSEEDLELFCNHDFFFRNIRFQTRLSHVSHYEYYLNALSSFQQLFPESYQLAIKGRESFVRQLIDDAKEARKAKKQKQMLEGRT